MISSKMASRLLAAAGGLVALLAATGANAGLTFTTGSLLSSPTFFNGFEGIGNYPYGTGFDYTGPYSEGGLTVQYINDDGIWTSSQAYQGLYSWYNDGGGNGYTKITRTDGGKMNDLTLAVSSGFGGCCATLYYDVKNNGVSIGSGAGNLIPGYGQGWALDGFTGAAFDEVDLQVSFNGAFSPNGFEAGAYDSIGANGAGVPEPATWAMMLIGLGGLGAVLRRPRKGLAIA
jgi:hypothetical protein